MKACRCYLVMAALLLVAGTEEYMARDCVM